MTKVVITKNPHKVKVNDVEIPGITSYEVDCVPTRGPIVEIKIKADILEVRDR